MPDCFYRITISSLADSQVNSIYCKKDNWYFTKNIAHRSGDFPIYILDSDSLSLENRYPGNRGVFRDV